MENIYTNLFLNSTTQIPSASLNYNLLTAEGEDVSYNAKNEELASVQNDVVKESVAGGKKKRVKKVRKPRFAFETRSHVDILDDGYRWRKYGQKVVKNNIFPRSYYRCPHQGCSVKKQVQRLSRDDTIVVTTYEGRHTHPIEKHTDNFEQLLTQMHVYPPFSTL